MAPKNDLVLRIITVTADPVRIEPRVKPESGPIKPEETETQEFNAGEPTVIERHEGPLVPTTFRNDLPRFGDGETTPSLSLVPVIEVAARLLIENGPSLESAMASLAAYYGETTTADPARLAELQSQIRGEILSQLQNSSPRIMDRSWMDQRGTAFLHFDATTGALIPGTRKPDAGSVFSVKVRMNGDTNRIELEPGTVENLNAFVDDGMPPALRDTIAAIIALEGRPIVEATAMGPEPSLLTAGTDVAEVVPKAPAGAVDAAIEAIFGFKTAGMTMLGGGRFSRQVLSINLRQGTLALGPNGEILGGSIAMPDYASPRGRVRNMGLSAGTPVDFIFGFPVAQGGRNPIIHFLGPQAALNSAQTAVVQGIMDRFAAHNETAFAENPYLIDACLASLGYRPHYLTDFPRSFAQALDEITRQGREDFNGTLRIDWDGFTGSYVARQTRGGETEPPLGTVRVVYWAETKTLSTRLQDASGLDANAAEGTSRFLDWFLERVKTDRPWYY